MNDIDTMLADSATRFFSDLCSRDVIDAVERGEWLAAAWAQTTEIGLAGAASMAIDEESTGLALDSLCRLAQLAGHFNVPLPLVETFVGQRALIRAGIPFDEQAPIGISTLAYQTPLLLTAKDTGGYQAQGRLARVAWGRHVNYVVAQAILDGQPCVTLLTGPFITEKQDTNLAGEPRDTLTFSGHNVDAAHVVVQADTNGFAHQVWESALFRSQQIAGALLRVLDMTIEYALEREQFGRPIAKFQAIQQQIAEQAGQTASAAAAADAAAYASKNLLACLPVAMAKIRSAEAATQACAIAHQVHGAMGFTHEHSLHLSTRRLLSWRDEFGSDAHWADWLGHQLQQRGSKPLWNLIAGDTHSTEPSLVQEKVA